MIRGLVLLLGKRVCDLEVGHRIRLAGEWFTITTVDFIPMEKVINPMDSAMVKTPWGELHAYCFGAVSEFVSVCPMFNRRVVAERSLGNGSKDVGEFTGHPFMPIDFEVEEPSDVDAPNPDRGSVLAVH